MTGLPSSTTFLAIMSLAMSDSAPDPAPQAERGEVLYRQYCGSCHSLDRNKYGPRHRGVYGSEAGAVADYSYSDALANAAIVWNADTLDRWLADPGAMLPGTRMRFRLDDAGERQSIIAYLASLSGEGSGERPRPALHTPAEQ